jgi:hypothetical protein
MKKLLFFFLTTLALMSCDKDDDAPQTLPEATQTGRGIFACYVNGKPFIDNSGSPNGISFNCFYQLVNGEYYFGIDGRNVIDGINSIILATNGRQIIENETYQLLSDNSGNVYGGCGFFIAFTSYELSLTNINYTGELNITKLDIENQIVSGTFWFDVENPFTGETVEIREGRFDTRFGT